MKLIFLLLLMIIGNCLFAQVPKLNFSSKYSIDYNKGRRIEFGLGTVYGLNKEEKHDGFQRKGLILEDIISAYSNEYLIGFTYGIDSWLNQTFYLSLLDPWRNIPNYNSNNIYYGYGMEFIILTFLFRVTAYNSGYYSFSFGFGN